MKGENKMAEVEYAGVKVGGSKLLLIIPLLGTIVGGLWGGFELYNRLMDAEEKISALQPQAIMAEVARMESVFEFIKEDLEHHKIGSKELENLYDALQLGGAGRWVKGHFVLVSIFFYSQTLHYCLSHEKLDIGWPKMIERCYDYFDKNEVGNIIPYWK